MAGTTDVEKLVVQMSADFKQYERALAKANSMTIRELRGIERQAQASLTKVESSFARFGKGLLAGLGVGSIAAFGSFIEGTISQAAKVGDLADKIGVTTDALQGLQFGAVQADMSFEDLDKSLLKFSKSLGEAANGQGDLLKTMRANGAELKGSFFENLLQFADLVKNAANEQDQMLLITQAFGRGGDGMLEFLKGGSEGLKVFAGEAKTVGAVIDEELIRKAQIIDDRWAALMQSLSSQTKSAVLTIIGEMQKLDDAIPGPVQLGERVGRFIEENVFGVPPPTSPGNALRQELTDRQPRAPDRVKAVTPTKIFNPEEDAAKKKRLAEANREAKRALDELTRSIEHQFEAFTRGLTAIDEDTAAMRLEAETLGLTTFEIERQRVAQELLNDANRAGIPVSKELNAVIQQKAVASGEAAQALEDLRKEDAQAAEVNNSIKDSFKGFASDVRSGIEPVEALTNALGRLADRLLDLALDGLLDNLLKTNNQGGGGIGALLTNILHTGGIAGSSGSRRSVSPLAFAGASRMHSGGLAGNEVPAILQKGELVIPRNVVPRLGSGGQKTEVNVITPPGAKVERQDRQQGGVNITDLIISTVQGGVVGGKLDRAFGARFGSNPVTTRR